MRGPRPNPHPDQKAVRRAAAAIRGRFRTWADAQEATGVNRATLCAAYKGKRVSRRTGNIIISAAQNMAAHDAKAEKRRRALKEYARPMVPREDYERVKRSGVSVADLVRRYLESEDDDG